MSITTRKEQILVNQWARLRDEQRERVSSAIERIRLLRDEPGRAIA